MPDERAGQVVKLVVLPRRRLGTAELPDHCRANLGAYKVPRQIVHRNQPLPKSHIGKILRRVDGEQESAHAAGPGVLAAHQAPCAHGAPTSH